MIEALTSIRRTPYQSLSGFLVLFLTLFLSTGIFIILTFLYGLLGYVETRPQVTVYFKTDTSESDIFKVREQLISSGKVLSIKYVNKQEAFKVYQQFTKDNPLLQQMVSADILPASLEIYAKQPEFLPQIAEFLGKQPGVDEVQFQKDIVSRLLTLTSILRKTSLVLFGFLILMSILVLITITLFKIALKKDEIELLRLLGASNFYIQKPFLLEGFLFGLFSSLTSFLILIGGLFYFYPFLTSYLRGIPALSLNLPHYSLQVWPLNIIFLSVTLVFSLFFGVGIAFISVLISTGRYFK